MNQTLNNELQEQIGDLLLWSDKDANEILNEVAAEHGIDTEALAVLVAWERAQQVRQRRRGRTEEFDEIFENSNYWK